MPPAPARHTLHWPMSSAPPGDSSAANAATSAPASVNVEQNDKGAQVKDFVPAEPQAIDYEAAVLRHSVKCYVSTKTASASGAPTLEHKHGFHLPKDGVRKPFTNKEACARFEKAQYGARRMLFNAGQKYKDMSPLGTRLLVLVGAPKKRMWCASLTLNPPLVRLYSDLDPEGLRP